MDIGVFFSGMAFIVIAFVVVGILKRVKPPPDPDDAMAGSPDVGWSAGYRPRPVDELPVDDALADPAPSGTDGADVLDEYLFDADELRLLGREQARRRLLALHLPAHQLDEVLDTLFGD